MSAHGTSTASKEKSLLAFADPSAFHQPNAITHKGLRTLTKYISLDDRVSPNALPAMITATSSWYSIKPHPAEYLDLGISVTWWNTKSRLSDTSTKYADLNMQRVVISLRTLIPGEPWIIYLLRPQLFPARKMWLSLIFTAQCSNITPGSCGPGTDTLVCLRMISVLFEYSPPVTHMSSELIMTDAADFLSKCISTALNHLKNCFPLYWLVLFFIAKGLPESFGETQWFW